MSTDTQLKGHSLERQVSLARAYAKENNLLLSEDNLHDIGLSAYAGANIKKGKLGIFIKGLEEGKIPSNSVLLVESLDRLSRQDPSTAYGQFNVILSYGVEIHTLFDRVIYTKETLKVNPGQLFLSIGIMLRAYSESEDKSQRLKKKWQSKRDHINDRILTTICPAWLTAKSDKSGFLVLDERAATVKKIFDLYIDDGMGTYSITKFLNNNISDYPKFTKAEKRNRDGAGKNKTGWQKSYVTKILNNPAVCGEFLPYMLIEGKRQKTEEIYENYFPAIITRERFMLAQAKMRERRVKGGGRKGESFNNIFTKLLLCKNCSVPIHYIDKGKPPKGGKYLRCSNAEFRHSCKAVAWRYEDFEDSFLNYVTEVEFADVFKKGDYPSQKAKLIEEEQINQEKIIKAEEEFTKRENFQADMPDSVQNRLKLKLIKLDEEITSLEQRQKTIKGEIALLDEQNSTKAQKELIEAIKKLQSEASESERARIRRRIHNQISAVISKIVVHTVTERFLPAEGLGNNLSYLVRRYLKEKNVSANESLVNYLATPKGQTIFQEMERYYVVHFKNGQERTVHPFIQHTWKFDNSQFIEFKERVQKNKAQKLVDEKRKQSKYKKRPVKTKS